MSTTLVNGDSKAPQTTLFKMPWENRCPQEPVVHKNFRKTLGKVGITGKGAGLEAWWRASEAVFRAVLKSFFYTDAAQRVQGWEMGIKCKPEHHFTLSQFLRTAKGNSFRSQVSAEVRD